MDMGHDPEWTWVTTLNGHGSEKKTFTGWTWLDIISHKGLAALIPSKALGVVVGVLAFLPFAQRFVRCFIFSCSLLHLWCRVEVS